LLRPTTTEYQLLQLLLSLLNLRKELHRGVGKGRREIGTGTAATLEGEDLVHSHRGQQTEPVARISLPKKKEGGRVEGKKGLREQLPQLPPHLA
jgi:hypothetical protein